jgi:hypothetical protein
VQEALDEASEEMERVARLWEEVDAEEGFADSSEDRVERLLGPRAAGDIRSLSDLTAMGLGGFGGFLARGPEGYRYFSDLMRTPLEEMPQEVPAVLYVLALLVSSFDDPAGVRSRAALFLNVLHEARAQDPEAMLAAAVRVQGSLGEAGATLASVGRSSKPLSRRPGYRRRP